MGCMSSKEARLDLQRSPPHYSRSFSMPVFHGSKSKGDSIHVVSLESSTLGSLRLDRKPESSPKEEVMRVSNDNNNKVTKAITLTPSANYGGKTTAKSPAAELETEMINAWELMEGLEEVSLPPTLDRSFSFNAIQKVNSRFSMETPPVLPKSSNTSTAGSPTPFWMQSTDGKPIQLDPDVISNFQKAMTELSPVHPTLLRQCSPLRTQEIPKFPGIVKKRIAAFQEQIDARRASFKATASFKVSPLERCPPGGKGKLVLYFTSLRGVRKTHEDCWNVRVILQSYGVRIDERDLSMHGGFKDELNGILGHGSSGIRLPSVFANGRYLGGAEEVMQMHEGGELRKALEDCEAATPAKVCGGLECEVCGDFKFILCETCSGSCKVFLGEYDEVGVFRRCSVCNENGLVRCAVCCY